MTIGNKNNNMASTKIKFKNLMKKNIYKQKILITNKYTIK